MQGCRTCSRVALVLFYFALGMIQKTRVSHLTNQTQKQNPQRFDHSPFPMLYLSREENEQSHLGRPATWINFDFLLASWLFTEISFIVVLSIYVKEFSRTYRRKYASCSDRSSINGSVRYRIILVKYIPDALTSWSLTLSIRYFYLSYKKNERSFSL